MRTIGHALRSAFAFVFVFASLSAQAQVVNGSFESGVVSPWATFTTSNGTLGPSSPTISSFDVDGDGVNSLAFGLSVGYAVAPCSFPGTGCPLPTEGGGIRQNVIFAGGLTQFHADVAVSNTLLSGGFNRDGGTFSLLLDGNLLNTFVTGQITAGAVLRGHLDASVFVSGGSHVLDILVTRQFSSANSLTQYIDNVSAAPIPEPETYAMMLVGLGLLGWARPRRI